VAVNRTWRNTDGEQQHKTTWFRIQAWQRQAEVCAQFVKKGDRILVVSENIESGAWIDRDGNAQGNIQLVPRLVRFLTPKSEHSGDIVADDAISVAADEPPF
jgi:single-strand DNA-binding protein